MKFPFPFYSFLSFGVVSESINVSALSANPLTCFSVMHMSTTLISFLSGWSWLQKIAFSLILLPFFSLISVKIDGIMFVLVSLCLKLLPGVASLKFEETRQLMNPPLFRNSMLSP